MVWMGASVLRGERILRTLLLIFSPRGTTTMQFRGPPLKEMAFAGPSNAV